MNPITALKKGLNYLLTNGPANSRFIYLGHGLVTIVGSAWLIFKFTHIGPDQRTGYIEMLLALNGTGVVPPALGRMLASKSTQNPQPQSVQQPYAVDVPPGTPVQPPPQTQAAPSSAFENPHGG